MSEPLETEAEAPIIEAEAEPDADAVEAEAIAMGWKPQSEFKGPDDKFVSAAEYVERGKTIMPFLRKELQGAYKKIEGLEKAVTESVRHISRAEARAYDQARKDLEAELDAAAAAGNVADVRAITKDIVDLDKKTIATAQEGPSPDFATWQETNDWYGKDKALSAAFDALCAEVHEEGYSTAKVGLKEATNRLKEQFPEKFAKPENPLRRQPGTVEGSGAVPRRTGKTFSDMPADAQAMCADFEKTIKGFKRDQYVKTYFEGQAK